MILEKVRLRAIERQRFAAFCGVAERTGGAQQFAGERAAFSGARRRLVRAGTQPTDGRTASGDRSEYAGRLENGGQWRLFDIDWRNRSAEIGIFIGEKNFWNQGYGTEAMRLMVKYGFDS